MQRLLILNLEQKFNAWCAVGWLVAARKL